MSSVSTAKGIGLGLVSGVAFGVALEKSKVALPSVIRGQMVFSTNIMFKMFLTASAVGMVSVIALEALLGIKRKPKAPVAFGLGLFGGYGGNVIGGAISGVGLALAGACPGVMAAQVGMGIPYSLIAAAGGMLGAVTYGYLEKILRENPKPNTLPHATKGKPETVDSYTARHPVLLAAVFGTLLGVIVYALEKYKSSNSELSALGYSTGTLSNISLKDEAWSPITAGALIGVLQIPTFVIMEDTLGMSSSYCTISGRGAAVVDKDMHKNAPYLSRFFQGVKNYWQVALIAGVTAGAYLSSSSSGVLAPPAVASGPISAFIGGYLILVGSRIADGCATGHGLSGMANLAFSSFVTLASMFGVGMAATNLLSYLPAF